MYLKRVLNEYSNNWWCWIYWKACYKTTFRKYKYYMNNTLNTTNLIKWTVENKIKKFIFTSTAPVYGNIKNNIKTDEKSEANPINPYGRINLMSEKILQDAANVTLGFKYVIFRYFNVSGADFFYKDNILAPRIGELHEPETHLIPLVAKTTLEKRETLNIFGDDFDTENGTCVKNYIHVEDLVNAHIEVIDYLENNESDIFNLGYGTGYSIKQIVNTMRSVIKNDIKIEIIKKETVILLFWFQII